MSTPPRFFIAPEQAAGALITVTGEDVRHIRTVLRKRPGDLLTLLDGRGAEFAVQIGEIRADRISTTILERKQHEFAGPRIVLGQAMPKSDRMDLVIQKATELGVAAIAPLVTERTIVKVKDAEKRVSRWRKVAREAAMQSRRFDIPRIAPIVPFDAFLANVVGGPSTLFLLPWEEGNRPLKDVLRSCPAAEDITVLIGPEGGFSPGEAGTARAKGFHAVSLGPTILRTETAAIAALSMISYEYRS